MTPAELLDDHARRPRNVGKLLNASAVGDIGSIVVGDALRFYIGVGQVPPSPGPGAPPGASAGTLLATGAEPRVTQAKFQVFNCATQVAVTSVLTELSAGRTLTEALRLGHRDICGHLSGLDHAALPPQLWGALGLASAIAAYRGETMVEDRELDALLCRCYAVTQETVRQAVAVRGCRTESEVVEATGAGTGCGTCRTDISALIDEVLHPPVAAPAAAGAARRAPAGRIQTMQRIRVLVEARLLPELRSAGGDLALWDFDGEHLSVKTTGALIGDLGARARALESLEQLLKAEIDARLQVADLT